MFADYRNVRRSLLTTRNLRLRVSLLINRYYVCKYNNTSRMVGFYLKRINRRGRENFSIWRWQCHWCHPPSAF